MFALKLLFDASVFDEWWLGLFRPIRLYVQSLPPCIPSFFFVLLHKLISLVHDDVIIFFAIRLYEKYYTIWVWHKKIVYMVKYFISYKDFLF